MDGLDISQRTRRALITTAVVMGGLVAAVGTVVLSYRLAGALSTIVYATLFAIGAGLLPGLIGLLGRATPMGGAVGKLHFILAQFIAGHGWFVQVGERYHHCPGDRDRFYFDGEWYDVDEGQTHRTALGWRPFGIVWVPDGERLIDARADPRALVERAGARTDGGADVERGGISQATPDSEVSGADGSWLIDLKALYRSGLDRAGDMDLVTVKEEQTMRDEVDGGAVDRWGAIIMFLFGLPAGAAIGYVVILA